MKNLRELAQRNLTAEQYAAHVAGMIHYLEENIFAAGQVKILSPVEMEVAVKRAKETQRKPVGIEGDEGLYGRQNGIRSRRAGYGGDLLSLREYVLGVDEPRRIDQKAYGKTDKFKIRQLEGEQESTMAIIADMRYLSDPIRQQQWIAELLNSLKMTDKEQQTGRRKAARRLSQIFFIVSEDGKAKVELVSLRPRSDKVKYDSLVENYVLPDILKEYRDKVQRSLAASPIPGLRPTDFYSDQENELYLGRKDLIDQEDTGADKEIFEQLGRLSKQIKARHAYFVGAGPSTRARLNTILRARRVEASYWKGNLAAPVRLQNGDKALLVKKSQAVSGGIDFDTGKINLEIKKKDGGIKLPSSSENLNNLQQIQFNGLVPEIINISPLNVPLFLGVSEQSDQKNPQISQLP